MAIWINRWHKGFNRLWLVLSCLLAFAFIGFNWLSGTYTPRTVPPIHYVVLPPGTPLLNPSEIPEAEKQKAEAKLKSYQTRQKWIARGRFVRDLLGSFIIIFAFGHGVFFVVRWIVRGFRLILLLVGALVIIGCGEGGRDLYPGAPVVSIKEISVDWVEPQIIGSVDVVRDGRQVQIPIFAEGELGQVRIHYLLSVLEPLPYDIKVKLALSGRSETRNG